MKGKIGQSMSFGLPVVTIYVGAEGIGLVQDENALIADKPKAFAEAVIRLYSDEVLWKRVSGEVLRHIKRKYSRDIIREKVARIFDNNKAKRGLRSNSQRMPNNEIHSP